MLAEYDNIKHITACPRCKTNLVERSESGLKLFCENIACAHSTNGFDIISGTPVLVDFAESILNQSDFKSSAGTSYLKRDAKRASLYSRLQHLLFGTNQAALRAAKRIVEDSISTVSNAEKAKILIIGGGELGSGSSELYQNEYVTIIGSDIYISPYTTLIADGHQLPFKDQSIEAVWIQAVLEHVLEPTVVVDEIYRVLKPEGLVYADTPFMQQVHEGAYDFTRFSLSGHRWLFRNFDLIDAGYVGGPGTALRWSISYFFRATFSNKVGTLAGLMFFWLRFFDNGLKTRAKADAASGTYFYGRKSTTTVGAKSMVTFYEKQRTDLSQAISSRAEV